MIRTPSYYVTPQMKAKWEQAIDAVCQPLVAEATTWPIYEQAGEDWPDAPSHCSALASISQAIKAWMNKESSTIFLAANAGLREQYCNQSVMLDARGQFFVKHWENGFGKSILKPTAAALTALEKRLDLRIDQEQRQSLTVRISVILRTAAWERLHVDGIEAPFCEHFLPILRAGHIPAGLRGSNWKSCTFLYA